MFYSKKKAMKYMAQSVEKIGFLSLGICADISAVEYIYRLTGRAG